MAAVADPLNLGGDAVAAVSPKTKKSPKAKKAPAKKLTKKPSHPRTMDMVVAAVKNLKERNGSSLQAIKKYIAANYKVDAEKLAPYVRKAVKSALTSGSLVQSKGKGASGSVKLPVVEKPIKKTTVAAKAKITKAKKVVASKPAKPAVKKLTKKAAPKKAATPAIPKKVAKPKVVKAPAKAKPAPKSPAKAKKIAKGTPTKKPKTPKPKKAAVRSKAPTRRAAKK